MGRLHGDAFGEKMKSPHDWRMPGKPKLTLNKAPSSNYRRRASQGWTSCFGGLSQNSLDSFRIEYLFYWSITNIWHFAWLVAFVRLDYGLQQKDCRLSLTVHSPLFSRIFIWFYPRIESRDNWTPAPNGRLDWVGVRQAIDCKADTTWKTFRDTNMTRTDKVGSQQWTAVSPFLGLVSTV